MNVPETDGEQLAGQLIRVGTVAAFVERNERVVTTVDGQEILVLAAGETIYAVGSRCTHLPFRLVQGPLVEETVEIECLLHQGRFSLETGEATRKPCRKPIPTYRVVHVDGEVYVDATRRIHSDRNP